MTANIGHIDKNIRIIVGTVLIITSVIGPVSLGWRIGMIAVAVIAFATAFINF